LRISGTELGIFSVLERTSSPDTDLRNVFPAFAPSQTFTAVTIRGFNYDSKWNLSMTEGKKYGGMRKVKTRREKPFKLEISNPRC
jgi:hypothetical protein